MVGCKGSGAGVWQKGTGYDGWVQGVRDRSMARKNHYHHVVV